MKKSLMLALLLGATSLYATSPEDFNGKENKNQPTNKKTTLTDLPQELISDIYTNMVILNNNTSLTKRDMAEPIKASRISKYFYEGCLPEYKKAQASLFNKRFPGALDIDSFANISSTKMRDMLDVMSMFMENEEIIKTSLPFTGNTNFKAFFEWFCDPVNQEKPLSQSYRSTLYKTLKNPRTQINNKIQLILQEFISDEYNKIKENIINIINTCPEFKGTVITSIPASVIVEFANDDQMETKIRNRAKKIKEFYKASPNVFLNTVNENLLLENHIFCLSLDETLIENLLKTQKGESNTPITDDISIFNHMLKSLSKNQIKTITKYSGLLFNKKFYTKNIITNISNANYDKMEQKLEIINENVGSFFKDCTKTEDYNSMMAALLRLNPRQIHVLAEHKDNAFKKTFNLEQYTSRIIWKLSELNPKTIESVLINSEKLLELTKSNINLTPDVIGAFSEYGSSQITEITKLAPIFMKNQEILEDVIKAFSECSAPTIKEIAHLAEKLSPESTYEIIYLMSVHRKSIPEDMVVEFFKLDENQVSIVMNKIYNSLEKKKGMPASELWEIFHEACKFSGEQK